MFDTDKGRILNREFREQGRFTPGWVTDTWNLPSGETMIKFKTLPVPSAPISIESEFENHATYLVNGIANLLFDYPPFINGETGGLYSQPYSMHNGPRGTTAAFNPLIKPDLQINSSNTRDFRYQKYGKIDQIVFSEMPSEKFDYIDTTIYCVGVTTNSRTHIPIRIVRYSGS